MAPGKNAYDTVATYISDSADNANSKIQSVDSVIWSQSDATIWVVVTG